MCVRPVMWMNEPDKGYYNTDAHTHTHTEHAVVGCMNAWYHAVGMSAWMYDPLSERTNLTEEQRRH